MFKQKFFFTVFLIYQLFSVLLISIGVWPRDLVYINLGLQIAAVLFFDYEYALYSIILSLPFYLVIPNTRFDSLSSWRFVVTALFLRLYFRKRKDFRFMSWDKALLIFLVIAFVSVLFAPDKAIGIKKILFVLNAYFLYASALNIVRTKEQIKKTVYALLGSLGTFVVFGFIQLYLTYTTSAFHFWQYWATFVSPVFFGQSLADSQVYSNTWFVFTNNQPTVLRMFSLLPDSHAFSVIAMFSIPFAAGILRYLKFNFEGKRKKLLTGLLWIYIALASLAIVLSGTRGVWVGAVVPFAVLLYLSLKPLGKKLILPMFIPILIFFFWIGTSPITLSFLNDLRTGRNNDNSFVQRIESIYDLNDSSNGQRLYIWKKTLINSLHNPLFGVGYGNFIFTLKDTVLPNISDYDKLSQITEGRFNVPGKYITAHNLYLDFLAETGLFGLVAILYLLQKLFTSFYLFFKQHYLYAEDWTVFLVTNIALCMIWLFAYSVFDGTLMNDRVLLAFFLVLAISGSIMKDFNKQNS